jgi:hypothetical protein
MSFDNALFISHCSVASLVRSGRRREHEDLVAPIGPFEFGFLPEALDRLEHVI